MPSDIGAKTGNKRGWAQRGVGTKNPAARMAADLTGGGLGSSTRRA